MSTEIDVNVLRPLLPKRPRDAHKGTFGHVFIIAGSRGFTGAAKLACEAAARSGAGLVTAGVPRPLGDVIAATLVEAMSFMLPATDAESLAHAALTPALEFAAGKQAVVLGPGISQHPETREFVLGFVQRCPVPLLIDADGVNCLSAEPGLLTKGEAERAVTPHPGEMARLIGGSTADVQKDREGVAAAFAAQHRCVVALKGYRTVIASPAGELYVNTTGNSGLATGGTGDILSGLVGGLMAQGVTVLDASLLGVYLHGLAGDIAAKRTTERAMIARDVLDALPQAWRSLEEGTAQ